MDVAVTITEAAESTGQTATPITIRAMVDTGASGTAIQTGFAKQLGLNPVGVQLISTPTSKDVPCPEYAMRLIFQANIVIDNVTVIEAPMEGQHVQMLIGRDVLKDFVFIYLGYANQFTLSR